MIGASLPSTIVLHWAIALHWARSSSEMEARLEVVTRVRGGERDERAVGGESWRKEEAGDARQADGGSPGGKQG